MRVLLDQGTPVSLREGLRNHEVSTTYEKGWFSLSNGELLRLAEAEFDAFVTTDQNLYHQQNLTELRLAILILPFANWPRLQKHLAKIVTAIDNLKSHDYVELVLE